MGWIKANLDESTHECLRREANNCDKNMSELAAERLRRSYTNSERNSVVDND